MTSLPKIGRFFRIGGPLFPSVFFCQYLAVSLSFWLLAALLAWAASRSS